MQASGTARRLIRSMDSEACTIDNWPSSVLQEAFKLLDQRYLYGIVPLVNKFWKDAALSSSRCLKLDLTNMEQFESVVAWIMKHGYCLHHVALSLPNHHSAPAFSRTLATSTRGLLRSLDLRHVGISTICSLECLSSLTSLTSLRLSSCLYISAPANMDALIASICCLQQLRNLDLPHNLLTFQPGMLWTLTANLQALTSLGLSWNSSETPGDLAVALQQLPQLQQFAIYPPAHLIPSDLPHLTAAGIPVTAARVKVASIQAGRGLIQIQTWLQQASASLVSLELVDSSSLGDPSVPGLQPQHTAALLAPLVKPLGATAAAAGAAETAAVASHGTINSVTEGGYSSFTGPQHQHIQSAAGAAAAAVQTGLQKPMHGGSSSSGHRRSRTVPGNAGARQCATRPSAAGVTSAAAGITAATATVVATGTTAATATEVAPTAPAAAALRELRLQGCCLDLNSIQALAVLTQLTGLKLSGCGLDSSLVRYLAKGLGPSAMLQSLSLGYSPGFTGGEGSAQSIGSCLVKLKHLEVVGSHRMSIRHAVHSVWAALEPRILLERVSLGGSVVAFTLRGE